MTQTMWKCKDCGEEFDDQDMLNDKELCEDTPSGVVKAIGVGPCPEVEESQVACGTTPVKGLGWRRVPDWNWIHNLDLVHRRADVDFHARSGTVGRQSRWYRIRRHFNARLDHPPRR